MKKTLSMLLVLTLLATLLMTVLPTGASADDWIYYLKIKGWYRTFKCDTDRYFVVDYNNIKYGPYSKKIDAVNLILDLQELYELMQATSKKGSFPGVEPGISLTR